MRRIPRSQRSIDPTGSLPHFPRHLIPSLPCRAALAPTPVLRSTSAPFSTSSRYNAVFDYQKDRKKHFNSIRKWQKRLLGSEEPIGSHVDPYDATSPVRIAPEELGEEEEVLEGEKESQFVYRPAKVADGLERLGGERYIKEKEEEALQQRYEQVVFKPLYPVQYKFAGQHLEKCRRIVDRQQLDERFHQAVVEVYTLKQAGKNMDLAAYPHAGHLPPRLDFPRVKVSLSPSDGLVLNFPDAESRSELLDIIENFQGPEEAQAIEQSEDLVDEAEVEELEAPAQPEQAPTEAEPVIKQVKGNPFDFVSNNGGVASSSDITTPEPVQAFDIEAVTASVQKSVSELRHSVLDSAAERTERAVAALRSQVRGHIESLGSESVSVIEPTASAPASHYPLTDPALKFALYKRLVFLTGHRLSDPVLNAVRNHGDLFRAFVDAATPNPTKLAEKVAESFQEPQLQNVKVFSKPVTEKQREQEIGRWKVIQYALHERGLPIEEQVRRERFTKRHPTVETVEQRARMLRKPKNAW